MHSNPDAAVVLRAKLKSFGQWVRMVVMESMTMKCTLTLMLLS